MKRRKGVQSVGPAGSSPLPAAVNAQAAAAEKACGAVQVLVLHVPTPTAGRQLQSRLTAALRQGKLVLVCHGSSKLCKLSAAILPGAIPVQQVRMMAAACHTLCLIRH